MNSGNPRITCIICTYRRTDLLPSAIGSIINQSLPSSAYEIIIVDNNSGDTTPQIVQSYANSSSVHLTYILESRKGLSHARNTGIQHAGGDIVAFLDDDAEADPNWLEALVKIYDKNPDAWAVGGKVLPLWDEERPVWLEDYLLRSLSIVEWGEKMRPLTWPERIIGTNCSFRKIVFSEVGLFVTNLGRKGNLLLGSEDTEIQERIHQRGKSIIYTPCAVVFHHISCERLTKKYFYRRSYGNGRTQALLSVRQQKEMALLWKEALFNGRLVLSTIRSVFIPTSRGGLSKFNLLQRLAYHLGFFYQSMYLLIFTPHVFKSHGQNVERKDYT